MASGEPGARPAAGRRVTPRPAPDPRTAAIVAAAVLWGSIGVISVGLFRLGVTPWEVAFWRAAISTAALGAWLLLFRRDLLRPGSPRDLLLLGSFGAVGVGLFYIAFQLANFLATVAVAVVLLYTAPVFVMLGAWLWLGEPLTPGKLGVGALVVLGVGATSLGTTGAEVRLSAAGVGWGIVAALAYSAYYLFGRRYLPRFGVLRTLFYSLAAGTLVLGAAAAAAGAAPRLALPAGAWPLLLGISLGTTLLANSLYYWGLERVEAGRASVVAAVEPVVAALLALLLFGQALTPLGWAGVGMVVLGVWAAPGAARERAHGLRAAGRSDPPDPEPNPS